MKLPSAKLSSLGQHYITWHYGQAYKDTYGIWMNFIWFVFYFFSVGALMSTLFDPWKRMGEDYPIGFSPILALQTFVVNTLMRIVGACVRLLVVGIGLTLASIVFILGVIVLLLWTVMPAFLVALVVIGLTLILFG